MICLCVLLRCFRSRLADYHMNCQVTPHTVTGCPQDNYHGCLMAYVGLIGEWSSLLSLTHGWIELIGGLTNWNV